MIQGASLLPLISQDSPCDGCGRTTPKVSTGLTSSYPNPSGDHLDHVRDRVAAGAEIYVGLSGGKDSVSVCLLLQRLGIPFRAIFADTGWEAELTYNYVRWFCTEREIDLIVVRGDGTEDGLLSVILRKGCFPKKQRRFCTELLKEHPIRAYLQTRVADGADVISVAGIRAEESAQRATMSTWAPADKRFGGVDCWHPVFDWTYEDTIQAHHDNHCKPNPLYLLGAERVGCFPCVFEKKAGLRIVSMLQPERLAKIRDMEEAVDQQVRRAKGDAYEERNYPTSTMFWLSINGQNRPALIDDVVERAWTPSNRKEAALLEDNLASQAAAAQERWGFTMEIDGLGADYTPDDGAKFANYADRYLTTKDLAARAAREAQTAPATQQLALFA